MKLSMCLGLIAACCLLLTGSVHAQNASAWFARAEQEAQAGNWSKAVLDYESAIRNNPKYVDAYVGLAHAYNNQGHYEDAIIACREAKQLSPQNVLVYYNLGAAYYQSATQLAAHLSKLKVQNQSTQSAKSNAQDPPEQKKLKKLWTSAQEAFDKAYALRSDSPDANIGVGLMHLHFNRIPQAVDSFKAALAITPDSAVAHLGLGMADIVARNHKDANSQLDVLKVLSPSMAQQLKDAMDKMSQSDADGVASNGAGSGKSDSSAKSAGHWPIGLSYVAGGLPIAVLAGWFLYTRSRVVEEGAAPERVEIKDPNVLLTTIQSPAVTTPYPRTIRQPQEILPALPSASGSLTATPIATTPRARPESTKLLDTPSHIATSNSQLRAGNTHFKAGKYQEALEAFRDALRMNPGSMEAFNGLGQCYARLEAWDDATDAYKQAIRINPDNAGVHCNLGDAYIALKRPQEALEAYKQAIRLTPNDPNAHYHYGMTSILLSDKATALDEFKILKKMSSEMANKLFNAIYPS